MTDSTQHFYCRTTTAEETTAAGRAFARTLVPGSCVGVCGTLGAGKTCFAHGIITALSAEDIVFQGSPTFSLLHEYTARAPFERIVHGDVYRIKNAEEMYAIGWDDYVTPSTLLLIEWADMFPELFPSYTRWIILEHSDTAASERIIRECAAPPSPASMTEK